MYKQVLYYNYSNLAMHYVKIISRSSTIHQHDKLFLGQQIQLVQDLSKLPNNGTYGQIYRIKLTCDDNTATWHFYRVVLSKNERELVEATLDSHKSSIDAVDYMSKILEAYSVHVDIGCNTATALRTGAGDMLAHSIVSQPSLLLYTAILS